MEKEVLYKYRVSAQLLFRYCFLTLTIGRKNTLFFGSEEGVEVATAYYTLIETCKFNGLAPLDYLTHVSMPAHDEKKDYKSLLPGKLALQTI